MIANKFNNQYTLYMMLMHIKILLLSRLHISYHVIDIYYLHSQKLYEKLYLFSAVVVV